MTRDDRDTSTEVFTSRAARRNAVVRFLAAAAGLALVTLALVTAVPSLTDPVWIRHRVAAFGPFAPLAFLALQTAQVVVAPIPGQVLGGVGGYLFGTVAGTAYSLLGVLLGSAIAIVLSRRLGRPYVERVLTPDSLARWDAFVQQHGVPGLFVLFLLPAFPDDLLCFAAGLSDLRVRTVLVLVLLGRGPSFLAAAYAGGRLAEGRLALFLTSLALLAGVSVVVVLLKDRFLALLEKIAPDGPGP